MHSTKTDKGTVFLHNGDYSGDLVIIRAPMEVTQNEENGCVYVTVPFEDVKQLVSNYVRDGLIGILEEATPDQILKRQPLRKRRKKTRV